MSADVYVFIHLNPPAREKRRPNLEVLRRKTGSNAENLRRRVDLRGLPFDVVARGTGATRMDGPLPD